MSTTARARVKPTSPSQRLRTLSRPQLPTSAVAGRSLRVWIAAIATSSANTASTTPVSTVLNSRDCSYGPDRTT